MHQLDTKMFFCRFLVGTIRPKHKTEKIMPFKNNLSGVSQIIELRADYRYNPIIDYD